MRVVRRLQVVDRRLVDARLLLGAAVGEEGRALPLALDPAHPGVTQHRARLQVLGRHLGDLLLLVLQVLLTDVARQAEALDLFVVLTAEAAFVGQAQTEAHRLGVQRVEQRANGVLDEGQARPDVLLRAVAIVLGQRPDHAVAGQASHQVLHRQAGESEAAQGSRQLGQVVVGAVVAGTEVVQKRLELVRLRVQLEEVALAPAGPLPGAERPRKAENGLRARLE